MILITIITFFSCSRNPLKVDISEIKEEVTIVRFEKELFALPMQDTLSELKQLRNEYPEFFDLFTWKVIGVGGIEEEHFPEIMGDFFTDTLIVNVKSLTDEKFADFDETEEHLITAFKYYRYHFPDKDLPTIFTMISGFNQSVVTAENIIGIGLDKYLGEDCGYYRQLRNVPLYKIKNMHPQKLVSDVVYAWGLTEFNDQGKATSVLDNIVHQGKLMYFADALLPEMHDSLKIGYTAGQLQWCRNNEPQMWNFLVEQKMLYSTKRMDILRFINDGPYTTGFPTESPARTGTWIGWQIVRQYMKKHEEVTMAELMKNTNYQQILNDSGYYPE
ncbi:gliding motility lipoprotein GldB [Mariniphaga sediminis]|uniref:gliding motility lipoprotein GldB n=1 Tax=Mariniphaga sediminis TaxID=1628158 RepID=UPI00356AA0BC